MNKKIIQIAQYLLFLGVGIFLVWWQLKSMTAEEWHEFTTALKNVHPGILIPIFVMALLSHLSRAIRWQILLEPLQYKPSLKNTYAAVLIGYLANAAVPRLGEVLKCTILAKYEKLKADKLFGTIIVERIFDFMCFLVFIAITILIQYELIGNYFKENLFIIADKKSDSLHSNKFYWILALIIAGIIIIYFLFTRFAKHPWVIKIKQVLSGLLDGLTAIKNIKRKKAFWGHTLFIWAMYMLQVYVGFNAMESTAHLQIPAAFAVLTLATLAMIATPGGIGAFPLLVMQILLIYAIPETQGKAFGWLLWGVNTGIIVLAGLVSLLLLPMMNREKDLSKNGDIQTSIE